jgi:hypothetical protein
MTVTRSRDESGGYWEIATDGGLPALEAWWQRKVRAAPGGRTFKDEVLCIRQDGEPRADVLTLTFGQVYDLIAALNQIVEDY